MSIINKSRVARYLKKSKIPATHRFAAVLGNLSGVVATTDEGYVYVTDKKANEMIVYNERVPLIAGLQILVGYDLSGSTPSLLQVLGGRNSHVVKPSPMMADHTHEWGKTGNTTWVRGEQIMPGLVHPFSSSLVIQVIGQAFWLAGWHVLDNTTIDLTPYVPTTGAKFILIESDESGVMTFTESAAVAGRELLLFEDIPDPTFGKYPWCAVKMYGGQTSIIQSLLDTDIIDLRFSHYAALGNEVVGLFTSQGLAGDGFRFGAGGRLAVIDDIDSALIIARDVSIHQWHVHLGDTGSAGTSIFDVHKNGVTVFTDQGKRPAVAFDNATGSAISSVADIISYAAGDVVTFCIDEVATGAENLSAVGSVLFPVVVTADSGLWKDAGDGDPVLTYTSDIALAFTGSLSRDTGESSGIYAITLGSLLPPSGYAITFVSADFSVSDDLTISGVTVIDSWNGLVSSRLWDLDDATDWGSDTRKPGGVWAKLDYGANVMVTQIRMLQQTNPAGATQFEIRTSTDDSAYTLIYTSPTDHPPIGENIIDLTPLEARYIKFICLAGNGGSGWDIFEASAKGWTI